MRPAPRPMSLEDVPAVHDLQIEAFDALAARVGRPPEPAPDAAMVAASHIRLSHLVTRDPAGAWVTQDDEGLTGCALALLREGIWGLSLLAVAPRAQSRGLGRALLHAALVYGAPHRGGIICASEDPWAMRAYARAGFRLKPQFSARGTPREIPAPPTVRRGGPADLELTARVDREIRGAARPEDIAAYLRAGFDLHVIDDRGYAVGAPHGLRVLAALDEEAAADLLRACRPKAVEFLTEEQQWALPVLFELGLDLESWGAVFVRGELGPLHPYVPGGAYL